MPKSSYFFKYILTGTDNVCTHKIRAMDKQEAYARFRYWAKHSENATKITKCWLSRGDSNVDES